MMQFTYNPSDGTYGYSDIDKSGACDQVILPESKPEAPKQKTLTLDDELLREPEFTGKVIEKNSEIPLGGDKITLPFIVLNRDGTVSAYIPEKDVPRLPKFDKYIANKIRRPVNFYTRRSDSKQLEHIASAFPGR